MVLQNEYSQCGNVIRKNKNYTMKTFLDGYEILAPLGLFEAFPTFHIQKRKSVLLISN